MILLRLIYLRDKNISRRACYYVGITLDDYDLKREENIIW